MGAANHISGHAFFSLGLEGDPLGLSWVWIYILGFCVLIAQQVRVQGVVLSLKPYLCLVIQQTHGRARSSGLRIRKVQLLSEHRGICFGARSMVWNQRWWCAARPVH